MYTMIVALQRFLQEHGEVQLSALGLGMFGLCFDPHFVPWFHMCSSACDSLCVLLAAISSMVTVAEILKNSKLAVEQSKFLLQAGLLPAVSCSSSKSHAV